MNRALLLLVLLLAGCAGPQVNRADDPSRPATASSVAMNILDSVLVGGFVGSHF